MNFGGLHRESMFGGLSTRFVKAANQAIQLFYVTEMQLQSGAASLKRLERFSYQACCLKQYNLSFLGVLFANSPSILFV